MSSPASSDATLIMNLTFYKWMKQFLCAQLNWSGGIFGLTNVTLVLRFMLKGSLNEEDLCGEMRGNEGGGLLTSHLGSAT